MQYATLEQLHASSISEVLRARSLSDHSQVVLKVLRGLVTSVAQANSVPEVKTLQQLLPHPRIVQLLRVLLDEEQQRLILVFQQHPTTLMHALRGRTSYLPLTRVRALLFDVLTGLAHMHSEHIAHTNIRPDNLLLNHGGDGLVVGDLSDARRVDVLTKRQPLPRGGDSLWYLAPEVLLKRERLCSPKQDVWAAGCVLFEMLTLCPPFVGAEPADVLDSIHEALGAPSEELLRELTPARLPTPTTTHREGGAGGGLRRLLPPHVPEDVAGLLERMLCYDPARRPSALRVLEHPFLEPLARGVMGTLLPAREERDPTRELTAAVKLYAPPADDAAPPVSPVCHQPAPITAALALKTPVPARRAESLPDLAVGGPAGTGRRGKMYSRQRIVHSLHVGLDEQPKVSSIPQQRPGSVAVGARGRGGADGARPKPQRAMTGPSLSASAVVRTGPLQSKGLGLLSRSMAMASMPGKPPRRRRMRLVRRSPPGEVGGSGSGSGPGAGAAEGEARVD